jgi:response regulator NasT
MLDCYGFLVVAQARNGLEAVEQARTNRPDVAILDLRMPELDGIEAARRIYAERPLPIVMLTAYADRASVEKAIAAGVFAYLVKPFRDTDLVPAIRTALARHDQLLRALQTVGKEPLRAIFMSVQGSSGRSWPLRLERRNDGSIDIQASSE